MDFPSLGSRTHSCGKNKDAWMRFAWRTMQYWGLLLLGPPLGINKGYRKVDSVMRICHKAWEMDTEGRHTTFRDTPNINVENVKQ